jgi:hypothetical protein
VLSEPQSPAAVALREAAQAVAHATKSKVGKPLNLMTTSGAAAAGDHAGHTH